MKVLVINAGSSSIKYRLFDMKYYTALAYGILEGIGAPDGQLKHQWRNDQRQYEEVVYRKPIPDYRQGLKRILNITTDTCSLDNVNALFGIGHRVVHGGEAFEEPALIDERVTEAIRKMTRLAPLHNPENLMAIEMALEECPGVPQVAVFDTAFHQSMPPQAYLYALPYEFFLLVSIIGKEMLWLREINRRHGYTVFLAGILIAAMIEYGKVSVLGVMQL